jgi:hypothetical protein
LLAKIRYQQHVSFHFSHLFFHFLKSVVDSSSTCLLWHL